MRIRLRTLAVATLLAGAPGNLPAQDPPAGNAPVSKKPTDIYRDARELLRTGNLELAAQTLKAFADAKPTAQDYLDLETKYGANTFQLLTNVPRWLPDLTKDQEFKTVLAGIIQDAQKANEKLTRDPERIRKFVRNLAATKEERDFAIDQLIRGQDAILPILVDNLRGDQSPEFQGGALTAVTRLGSDVIPGLLIAAEYLPENVRLGLLQSIARRPDVLSLASKPDTDPTPLLWYLSSAGANSPAGTTAQEILRTLTGDRSDRLTAWGELTRMAGMTAARKAPFAALDAPKNQVTSWDWDASTNSLKRVLLNPSQAEERYALKWLRWALERNPEYTPAQEAFVSVATERAVERSGYIDLIRTEPAAYELLSKTPTSVLRDVLDTALTDRRTAAAFAATLGLADRFDSSAAGALKKALAYADPRVQLAAAVGLLRLPKTDSSVNAQIVEVLSRAVGGDSSAPNATGKAIVVDPMAVRAERVTNLLRGLGYDTETLGTGRELVRRIARSSDVDLIVLDRHVVDPLLPDLLPQLAADTRLARRPIAVIASADKPLPIGVEPLLLRLAVLVAVTETNDITIPSPYLNDPRKPNDENELARAKSTRERDRQFLLLADARLARMKRIVDAANLGQSQQLLNRLNLRLPQLTLAAVIAEFNPVATTAPTPFRNLSNYTDLIRRQTDVDGVLERVPTEALEKLIQQLESALTTKELRDAFDQLRRRIDPEALALTSGPTLDVQVIGDVTRQVRNYPGVSVIPEPYSTVGFGDDLKAATVRSTTFGRPAFLPRVGFSQDIQAAVTDPTLSPRTPAEKKAAAKVAVEWLRRLAVSEKPGYDLRPAVTGLRSALASDDLSVPAAETLSRIATAEAQSDLVRLASTAGRSAVVRENAAEAATRSAQAFGKLASADVVKALAAATQAETNVDVKARLSILTTALLGTPSDLLSAIQSYAPKTVKPVAKEEKPKEEPKKEN